MAVVLGNYVANKTISVIDATIEHQIKIDTIKTLVKDLDKQVEMANDMYDTYWYIKDNDKEFANKLWNLLCRNKIGDIDINSYFSWGIGIGSYAHISRYGVNIYNCRIKDKLLLLHNDEKELYRGKVMLLDYIAHFDLDDKIIDQIIRELKAFLVHFNDYANTFFECVSNYKVPKFD